MARTYPVSDDWAASAHVDNDTYLAMYRHSVEDNAGFWAEHGKRITWV